MEIVTLATPSLGDRSYVVLSGGKAAVIDPQRDIDRLLSILREHGAELTHVFETHVHNDYITGGLELARRSGAAYVLAAVDDVGYERTPAAHGEPFGVGEVCIEAVHTPGHTPTHLSYVVVRDGRPVAAFTGGSMLFGTVGRTDLISTDATGALTRAQFHTVRRLAELPGDVSVHPTHGFGSFCSSSSSSGAESSTIADERAGNIALQTDAEETFVQQLLSGLTAYPAYYAHMAPMNRAGPPPVDLSPPAWLDPKTVRRRIDAGEWVVDLRSREAFANGHLYGTINLELSESFVTYLGWTIPWGTPVTLLGEAVTDVLEAQREMVRIGIDRPAGAMFGGLSAWASDDQVRSFASLSFADLAAAREQGRVQVLDVRREDEWADGHLADATHIPLAQLEDRMDTVPAGEVWVHCATGYRAAVAASLLDRAGHDVIAIDDDWEAATERPDLTLASN